MLDLNPRDNALLKRCSRGDSCINSNGPLLPATTAFFPEHNNKLQALCRACCNEKARIWYAKHRERAAEYRRRRYIEHPEKVLEEQRVWRANNPEKVRATNSRYRSKHPEKVHQFSRQYRIKHPEKVREYSRRYRVKHSLLKISEYRRDWNASNRHKKKIYNYRRRERFGRLPHTFTIDDGIAALLYWRQRCAYCGKQLNQLSMFESVEVQFDHYIALSDPRPDNPGSVAINMVPACPSCNSSKHSKDPVEWITWKFGPRKARRIINAIDVFVLSVKARLSRETPK